MTIGVVDAAAPDVPVASPNRTAAFELPTARVDRRSFVAEASQDPGKLWTLGLWLALVLVGLLTHWYGR